MYLSQFGFGAEAFRARLHFFAQFKAVNALVKAGVVINLRGLRHLPTGRQLFQHERIQPGTGGVQRGGIAARAAADDDHIIDVIHIHSFFLPGCSGLSCSGQASVSAMKASIFALDSGATIEPSGAPFL